MEDRTLLLLSNVLIRTMLLSNKEMFFLHFSVIDKTETKTQTGQEGERLAPKERERDHGENLSGLWLCGKLTRMATTGVLYSRTNVQTLLRTDFHRRLLSNFFILLRALEHWSLIGCLRNLAVRLLSMCV